MMTDRLSEIEARVNAATLGPWEYSWTQVPSQVREDEPVMRCVTAPLPGSVMGMIVYGLEERGNAQDDTNATFIAHARSDVPWLVARVRELETALTRLSPDQMDWLATWLDFTDEIIATLGEKNEHLTDLAAISQATRGDELQHALRAMASDARAALAPAEQEKQR